MVQGGWTPFADAPGGFTLAELDGVAPKNPLFVQEGYSVVYANSLALKAVALNPADGARQRWGWSFQPPYAVRVRCARFAAARPKPPPNTCTERIPSDSPPVTGPGAKSKYLAERAAKGPSLPLSS